MMPDLHPVRSDTLLKAAEGRECQLKFPGICYGGTETTVAAHIRDRFKGMGIKASDHSTIHACFWCHHYLDVQHGTKPIMSDADLYLHIIAALQETWLVLIHAKVIKLRVNKPRVAKIKARKPKDQRQSIAQRKDAWPPKGTQRIQSANRLARKSKKERI